MTVEDVGLDNDTGYMQSIDRNDQRRFTRPWLAWGNSLLAEFISQRLPDICRSPPLGNELLPPTSRHVHGQETFQDFYDRCRASLHRLQCRKQKRRFAPKPTHVQLLGDDQVSQNITSCQYGPIQPFPLSQRPSQNQVPCNSPQNGDQGHRPFWWPSYLASLGLCRCPKL